jgi:endonuclease VIII-like 1
MPEGPELRIMCDFINQASKDRSFSKLYHVGKGNVPDDSNLIDGFEVSANSFGKEMQLNTYNIKSNLVFSVFMGMSGNWSFVPTIEWEQTKFVRLRMDTDDGYSLLLHGGYMGPKYKLGKFSGVSRGPDPVKEFDLFSRNITDNLSNKAFNDPICEVLLNQKYFSGVGNYLRSSILYYADVNPFESARDSIKNNPNIIDLCRDIQVKSYQLNGGQLRDWKNPLGKDSKEFHDWVFYKKGLSVKDGTGRTFWFQEKWKSKNPF